MHACRISLDLKTGIQASAQHGCVRMHAWKNRAALERACSVQIEIQPEDREQQVHTALGC